MRRSCSKQEQADIGLAALPFECHHPNHNRPRSPSRDRGGSHLHCPETDVLVAGQVIDYLARVRSPLVENHCVVVLMGENPSLANSMLS